MSEPKSNLRRRLRGSIALVVLASSACSASASPTSPLPARMSVVAVVDPSTSPPIPVVVPTSTVSVGGPSISMPTPSSIPTSRPTPAATVSPGRHVAPTRVVLVGDSLAAQAATYLRPLLGRKVLVPRFFSGTAPCDWRAMDLPATAESVVVISFTGNSYTPCMSDGSGGQLHGASLVAAYRADLNVLVATLRADGASVLLVGQPVDSDALPGNDDIVAINAIYEALAQTTGTSFVDAGLAVENSDGGFAHELPCLPGEPECGAGGANVVRNDDGLHFCPGPPRSGLCAVYSSGAFRFADAIAAAVNQL